MEATQMLYQHGTISLQLYETAAESAQQLGVKPIEVLLLARLYTPHELARMLARLAWVPCWLSWPAMAIRKDLCACIPGLSAVEHRVAPLYRDADGDLVIAMADPADEAAQCEATFFAGSELRRVAVPAPMVSAAVYALYGEQTPFALLWRRLNATHNRSAAAVVRSMQAR